MPWLDSHGKQEQDRVKWEDRIGSSLGGQERFGLGASQNSGGGGKQISVRLRPAGLQSKFWDGCVHTEKLRPEKQNKKRRIWVLLSIQGKILIRSAM